MFQFTWLYFEGNFMGPGDFIIGQMFTWIRNILACLQTCYFFLFVDFALCSDIVQGPQNVTVLAGSNARFTCTVKAGWKSISWYLKDIFVVSISPTGTDVSGTQLVVRNNTNTITGEFTTEIIIINVQKNNSGTVRCSSLSASFQDAYLMVQGRYKTTFTIGWPGFN